MAVMHWGTTESVTGSKLAGFKELVPSSSRWRFQVGATGETRREGYQEGRYGSGRHVGVKNASRAGPELLLVAGKLRVSNERERGSHGPFRDRGPR